MSAIFTDETNVVDTTTETEVFTTNLGSINYDRLVRLKLFGVVNNNATLSDTIQVALYLNDTLVTYGIGTPDDGSPFLCATYDLLLKESSDQLGTTVLLLGESAGGDDNDGATHLHLNPTSIDTDTDSTLSIRVTLGAANSNFGLTVKSVILEYLI